MFQNQTFNFLNHRFSSNFQRRHRRSTHANEFIRITKRHSLIVINIFLVQSHKMHETRRAINNFQRAFFHQIRKLNERCLRWKLNIFSQRSISRVPYVESITKWLGLRARAHTPKCVLQKNKSIFSSRFYANRNFAKELSQLFVEFVSVWVRVEVWPRVFHFCARRFVTCLRATCIEIFGIAKLWFISRILASNANVLLIDKCWMRIFSAYLKSIYFSAECSTLTTGFESMWHYVSQSLGE